MLLSLVAVGGATSGTQEADAAPRGRPNIVFVMTDDMPERLLPSMPAVNDLLVRRGVTFRNAYVTQSLCCPSRASYLTGTYPHNHGVTTNIPPYGGEPRFRELGRDRNTVATWLRGSGYRTAFVGKYLNGTAGTYVPPGWSAWWGMTQDAAGRRMLNDNRTMRELPRAHSTDAFRDLSLGFLGRATDQASDPPFALFVWPTAPHLPAKPATRHANLFSGSPLPKPPSFDEADVSDKPRWVQDMPRISPTQATALREGHLTQLRTLRAVDEMVASIVKLLKDRGELQNTYIVFGTDNGVHMGQHRWHFVRGAKSTAYEEAASVPLVVRGPGIPAGQTRDQLVANNDIAPTFAQWAGVRPQGVVDGRSLVPLLGYAPPPEWRTALLNERHLTVPDDAPVPNYDAVITADHTYVEYETGERELYDRRTDPYQVRSTHETADPTLVADLKASMNALKECAGEACKVAEDTTPKEAAPPVE